VEGDVEKLSRLHGRPERRVLAALDATPVEEMTLEEVAPSLNEVRVATASERSGARKTVRKVLAQARR
jgi:hypothetical protein